LSFAIPLRLSKLDIQNFVASLKLEKMSPDPHQGGRLEDMAAEGTTIPGDAGKHNLVSRMTL